MPKRMPITPNAAPSQDITAYLAKVDAEKRAALEKLRRVIRAAAPRAEEGISYGIPAFRLHGRVLVAFAAAKFHCSFYPGALPLKLHRFDLVDYDTSKGTIRFAPEKPLHTTLVRKLIKARIAEIRAKIRDK